ncbi:uncharacterized protein LOC110167687 [Boleophthalmus pectinirostris]|uniref:uncharacterized protein LOC110167687 n=1 Tax=Boleophthalmus pectinirostris TaxID=150288 RepID=UPI002430A9FD|nr:uncharacterized protein LOC110167687 [Boleophthalmus pectinirostris]
MAMSLKRTEGVTVITLTSDTSSTCPPVCQLLGSLCYTPALCSRHMAIPRRGSLTVLGSLWIMAGLMQPALAAILFSNRGTASFSLLDTYCPMWIGAVFVVVGVSNIQTEKNPHPCVLLFNSILSLAGAVMSVFAIIWYSSQFTFYCYSPIFRCLDLGNDYYWHGRQTTTPNPHEEAVRQQTRKVQQALKSVVFGVSVVLMAMAVLGPCLWLSSTILSIKALKSPQDKSESTDLSRSTDLSKDLSTALLEDDGTAASQHDQE